MAGKVKLTTQKQSVLRDISVYGRVSRNITDQMCKWQATACRRLQRQGLLDENNDITPAGRAHLASSGKGD